MAKRNRRNKRDMTTWRRIREEWCELEFTNKIVLFIGLILFLELIFANFIGGQHDWRAMSFRTSLGAIIGYIIGGMGAPPENEEDLDEDEEEDEFPVDKDIWRGVDMRSGEEHREDIPEYDDVCQSGSRGIQSTRYLRSLAAGIICITSIIVVFIMSFLDINHYPDGALQLRDMISMTLGYLVSSSSRVR